ncbi:hypothetical protein CLPUN_28060 [Clostridium puniceum]|uniref:Uncharacterized protein n=1 Tax=Clostridium puniceum TaxID=29367 RepID=A0A1S8TEJ2_9CLOT|nr:hypothetical protein [Clostridium puniceum]OOM76193.1 hypothetical protein CLPUN_28060 [Clostridium puniceum]
MQKKKILIVFLISIFMFGEVSQAEQIPTSTTLKQGIYKISPEHKGYYRNIKLVSPGKPVTIIVLDSNGAQVLVAKLDNENEYLKVGPIEKGETLIINGDGEISVVH